MAKKTSEAKPEVTEVAPDLTVRISRFLTNILGTPSCHNFHAEAAALRELVGVAPPAVPEREQGETAFSQR